MLQLIVSIMEGPLPNQLVISRQEDTSNFGMLSMQLCGSKMSRIDVAAGGSLPVQLGLCGGRTYVHLYSSLLCQPSEQQETPCSQ